jgi:hypothetical protein
MNAGLFLATLLISTCGVAQEGLLSFQLPPEPWRELQYLAAEDTVKSLADYSAGKVKTRHPTPRAESQVGMLCVAVKLYAERLRAIGRPPNTADPVKMVFVRADADSRVNVQLAAGELNVLLGRREVPRIARCDALDSRADLEVRASRGLRDEHIVPQRLEGLLVPQIGDAPLMARERPIPEEGLCLCVTSGNPDRVEGPGF